MKKIFSLALLLMLCVSLFSCAPKEEDDPLAALNDNTETVAALKSAMAELGYDIVFDNYKEYFTSKLKDMESAESFTEEELQSGYSIVFSHPEKNRVVFLCFNTRDLARRYYNAYCEKHTDYTKCARREGGVVTIILPTMWCRISVRMRSINWRDCH